jgi:hypothetical protein
LLGAAFLAKSKSVSGIFVFFQREFGNSRSIRIHDGHLPIREPNVNMPSARSLLAISLAPLQAASTFEKSSLVRQQRSCCSKNSTLNFGMPKGQRGRSN